MRRRRARLVTLLSRWSAAGDRWYGIFMSIVVAVVFMIAAMFGVFVFSLWARDQATFASADPAQVQANSFAVMQIAGGIASSGVTVFALTFALIEFARNRARPSLELVFIDRKADAEVSRLEIAAVTGDPHWHEIHLAILNHGNLSAVWFMVELDVPFLDGFVAANAHRWQVDLTDPLSGPILDFDHRRAINDFVIAASQRGHWYFEWQGRTARASLRFESHGELAVYPGSATALARIRVPTEALRMHRTYRCSYRIFSDGSGPVDDSLAIRVKPKTPGVINVTRESH